MRNLGCSAVLLRTRRCHVVSPLCSCLPLSFSLETRWDIQAFELWVKIALLVRFNSIEVRVIQSSNEVMVLTRALCIVQERQKQMVYQAVGWGIPLLFAIIGLSQPNGFSGASTTLPLYAAAASVCCLTCCP